jgi:ABC-2 type transport system ATP-binding protein
VHSVIEIDQVSRSFKNLRAVDSLSLQVRAGESLGLLGPNGAGKTTLVEMIEGIQTPDDGEIRLFGKTWREGGDSLRKRIGVALQEASFMEKVTVLETLHMFSSFQGARSERAAEVMASMNLTEKADAYCGTLSGGQKQRLALGIALLAEPEIIILDEPTTGLDPGVRREIWDILADLKKKGTTLILTTHYMEEAEVLCDRIVVMDRGRILREGRLGDLLKEGGEIIEFSCKKTPDHSHFKRLPGFVSFEIREGGGLLKVRDMARAVPGFLQIMTRAKAGLKDLECRKSTLDDLFVSMTGRRLEE